MEERVFRGPSSTFTDTTQTRTEPNENARNRGLISKLDRAEERINELGNK